MTSKEKASRLIADFIKHSRAEKDIKPIQSAKQCALIAVNEILNNFGSRLEGNTHYCNYSTIQFYEEVKQEINKL